MSEAPGNSPKLTVTTSATTVTSAVVAVPPERGPREAVQASTAATISRTISLEHVLSKQLPNLGVIVSILWLRSATVFWTSVIDLFATISGTAPAKAIAPAARTVKMVEKRMMKRLEKAAWLGTTGGVDGRLS